MTRPEDERDPEAEADFDRELAKMMSEGVETRKERRTTAFDLPLPMRRVQKELQHTEDTTHDMAPVPAGTIKFSLMSKRGNKPQVLSLFLSSSHTLT